MFEKYKIYKYGSWWGISKRFLLFFRRRMRYTKIVQYATGSSSSSRELLLFTMSDILGAGGELSWLNSTGQELKRKVYKVGEVIEIHRK